MRAPAGTFTAVRRITPPGTVARYSDFGVAVDSQGTAYYVWTAAGSDRRYVRTRVRYADGTLGAVQTLASAPGTGDGDNTDEVDVGVDESGRAVFSWILYRPGQASLQVRTRSPAGKLGPTLDVGTGGYYGMTVTPAGRAIFGWQARAGYLARVLSPAGRLGPQLRVSATADAGGQVASGGENVVFSWQQPGPGDDARMMTRELSAGGSLGPPQAIARGNVTSSGSGEGLVAVAPDGTAAYYWWASGRPEARVRSPSGSLGPIVHVFGDLHQDTGLEVVGDANDDFLFLADNVVLGGKLRSIVRTRSADGTWGPIHVLSPPGFNAYSGQVAINAAGDAAATWFEGKRGFAVQGVFGP